MSKKCKKVQKKICLEWDLNPGRKIVEKVTFLYSNEKLYCVFAEGVKRQTTDRRTDIRRTIVFFPNEKMH